MDNIAGKGDNNLLKRYPAGSFAHFEKYLRDESSLEEPNPDGIEIVSVHQPIHVSGGDSLRGFNLGAGGDFGARCSDVLQKTVLYAKRKGIRKVVVHGVHVPKGDDAGDVWKKMVSRLKRSLVEGVELCIEFDAIWLNTIKGGMPLFTSIDDFRKLFNEAPFPVYCCLDVEHAILSAFFRAFKKRSGSWASSEREMIDFIRSHPDMIRKTADKAVSEAFDILGDRIQVVHICGSDYTQYEFDKQTVLPLIGEHLPIGYRGQAAGIDVRDMNDYKVIAKGIRRLKADVPIVIEIGLRKDYDFIEQMLKSKEHLESFLKVIQDD